MYISNGWGRAVAVKLGELNVLVSDKGVSEKKFLMRPVLCPIFQYMYIRSRKCLGGWRAWSNIYYCLNSPSLPPLCFFFFFFFLSFYLMCTYCMLLISFVLLTATLASISIAPTTSSSSEDLLIPYLSATPVSVVISSSSVPLTSQLATETPVLGGGDPTKSPPGSPAGV